MTDDEKKLDELQRDIVDLKEGEALAAVGELLRAGVEYRRVMWRFRLALLEIGQKYQDGEYYMTGLVMAGEITRLAMEMMRPQIKLDLGERERQGLIIIGTIEGDIHDLGKNLAKYFLEADGFEVEDLGVDVPPQVFLRQVLRREPDAVGVSLLLTACIEPLRKLVALMRETYPEDRPAPPLFAGCGFLRPPGDVSGPLSGAMESGRLGVDYVVTDAYDTLQLCRKLVAGKAKKTAP